MKVRELLQIEIWSKRTTRRILVGIGVAVGLICTWIAAELYWITPGERNAARIGIAQIDSIQNLDSISDEDFDAWDKQAVEKVEAARLAARTIRDERIADALYGYLSAIEVGRSNVKMRKLMQERHVPIKDSQQKLDDEIDSTGKQVTQFLRSVLHRALD